MVKDGNNNKHNWPTKEKAKASKRAKAQSTYATDVAWKGIKARVLRWQCTTSMTKQHISLTSYHNGGQAQDRHTPETGGTKITQEQHNRQQQHSSKDSRCQDYLWP